MTLTPHTLQTFTHVNKGVNGVVRCGFRPFLAPHFTVRFS